MYLFISPETNNFLKYVAVFFEKENLDDLNDPGVALSDILGYHDFLS